MTDDPAELPPRLFTVHRSVLFVDPASGELRHGPHETSPPNVRLVCEGRHARIVSTDSGKEWPVVCTAGCSQALRGGVRETATSFEVIPLQQRWIALKARGLFLSANADGSVALSATLCRAWENFLPADPPWRQPVLDSGVVHGAPSLSISCIENRDPTHAVRAVERTAGCIRADALYWFSNAPFPNRLPGIEVVNILIPDFRDFFSDINQLCLRLMPRVVKTDFNLVVQADGFAVNPQAWDDAFWEYDYIGAPWRKDGGLYWRGPIVGNGGFSLRSRKLYEALLSTEVKWRVEDWAHDPRLEDPNYYVTTAQGDKHLPEDVLICAWYRQHLEREFGIRFCPPELAARFSVESRSPLTECWLGQSFGFHGFWAGSYYGLSW